MKVMLNSEQRRKIYNLKHRLKVGDLTWARYHELLTRIYNES